MKSDVNMLLLRRGPPEIMGENHPLLYCKPSADQARWCTNSLRCIFVPEVNLCVYVERVSF